ncbi:M15 family metallopeptidase [Gloeothece verrucosa]|uniref:D-alanyl-D-alanine dipeptidase n=1 Tax=Gloeothece verrucosa (strain PCC 7822) TaxID=497965 RepID=E0UBS6_GLOV7|nr:M15 family metallopeptidase [Gloeothece verrucosa]ADN15141.1 peptidase M15D vanX D-ala-D-ala dipeptidase [Gloeothece verrucosa PCC 7822]
MSIASVKPYQTLLIEECGEPLVPIPLNLFAVESPHPYEKLGADYGGKSPYFLRQGVLEALINAQRNLQKDYPRWHILIFDAYRPVSVQQFMVDYTFATVLQERRLTENNLSPQQRQEIWQEVYKIWAVANDNPATPPPHSTGAAVDITLVDATGKPIDMGGDIDELSDRSHPLYYANSTMAQEQDYHTHRELLHQVMRAAGFRRHLGEWWHFSLGDQMWAWLYNQEQPLQPVIARYGGV